MMIAVLRIRTGSLTLSTAFTTDDTKITEERDMLVALEYVFKNLFLDRETTKAISLSIVPADGFPYYV